MTIIELQQLIDSTTQVESTLLFNKNKEYTKGSIDVLLNFKEIANELNISPFKVWHVLYKKHSNSLLHWLNDGEMSSGESIESRITDLRNYLLILKGLIIDIKGGLK
jgi:hypothetical protein